MVFRRVHSLEPAVKLITRVYERLIRHEDKRYTFVLCRVVVYRPMFYICIVVWSSYSSPDIS